MDCVSDANGKDKGEQIVITDIDTKVEMMELLLNKLTELHCVATELGDEDTASAISVAEDTLINSIKFEKASKNGNNI